MEFCGNCTKKNKKKENQDKNKTCLHKMLMEYWAGFCLGSRIDRFERMGYHYAFFKKMPSLLRDSVTFRKLKKSVLWWVILQYGPSQTNTFTQTKPLDSHCRFVSPEKTFSGSWVISFLLRFRRVVFVGKLMFSSRVELTPFPSQSTLWVEQEHKLLQTSQFNKLHMESIATAKSQNLFIFKTWNSFN